MLLVYSEIMSSRFEIGYCSNIICRYSTVHDLKQDGARAISEIQTSVKFPAPRTGDVTQHLQLSDRVFQSSTLHPPRRKAHSTARIPFTAPQPAQFISKQPQQPARISSIIPIDPEPAQPSRHNSSRSSPSPTPLDLYVATADRRSTQASDLTSSQK